MSKEIWLLIKSGGSYEDAYSYPIRAYEDKSDAECEMEKLNKELQDMCDNYDALVELSDKHYDLHCVGCIKEDCHECEYYIDLPYEDEQNPYSIERLELIGMVNNMALDLYIQVLVILENDTDYPTNDSKASAIRKLIDREIVDKFQDLIMEYQKECEK